MNTNLLLAIAGPAIVGFGFLGFKDGTGRFLIPLALLFLALFYFIATKYFGVEIDFLSLPV